MLRAALIGTGYWGPNLANSIERTGKAVVHALCDACPDNLGSLARRYPYARTTTDVGEVLQDDGVDAVFIATPTTTHYELGKRVLEAGKHVLIEKPITTSSPEAAALVRLARERDRVLMVGHVFEYSPAIRIVDDRIKAGELGEIYYMNVGQRASAQVSWVGHLTVATIVAMTVCVVWAKPLLSL